MATQIDIITSKNVALRVVDRLKLATNPGRGRAVQRSATDGRGNNMRDWLADLLLKQARHRALARSSVVDISFKGADPQLRRGSGQRLRRGIPEDQRAAQDRADEEGLVLLQRTDQAAAR
jgi:uncharacterized protein involved in exopolysaccharide biosynthesis